MKNSLPYILVSGLLVLFTSFSAQAITLNITPSAQTIVVGNPVSVDLQISGLGHLSFDSLSVFDLDVNFDSAVLAFDNVSYGNQLDLFGAGSIIETTSGLGFVNLAESSFNMPWELDDNQAGAFTLATLSFNTLALGTSSLVMSVNVLGDAWGDALTASVLNDGSVTVVPIPGALLLLLSGLFAGGLLGFNRKSSRNL